jgi:radical SAM protein with 4Fe4S-binding SPASM domain
MTDPFYIQWHITHRCDVRCGHCYQESFSERDDLGLPELVTLADGILDTMAQWGRPVCFNLTGGEPILKPEFFPLLEDLGRRPGVAELGVITNGLGFDRDLVRRLSTLPKLDCVKVSLDGADARTHDAIRREGTFDRTLRSIGLLREEGRFKTVLMFTVMRRNWRSLPSLVRLCEALSVDGLILERFVPWGRGRSRGEEVLDRQEWGAFLNSLLGLFSIPPENGDLSPFQAFQIDFTDGDAELLGAPCVAGTDGLCLMPEGTVYPCRRFPVPVGNLRTDSLARLWETSHVLKDIRRRDRLKGKCGTCRREGCRGCRSLALSLCGDYLAEDPHCGLPVP